MWRRKSNVISRWHNEILSSYRTFSFSAPQSLTLFDGIILTSKLKLQLYHNIKQKANTKLKTLHPPFLFPSIRPIQPMTGCNSLLDLFFLLYCERSCSLVWSIFHFSVSTSFYCWAKIQIKRAFKGALFCRGNFMLALSVALTLVFYLDMTNCKAVFSRLTMNPNFLVPFDQSEQA